MASNAAPTPLQFDHSQSRCVAISDETGEYMRQHADNIVGWLNMIGDAAFLVAGTAAFAAAPGVVSGITAGMGGVYCLGDLPLMMSGDNKSNSLEKVHETKPVTTTEYITEHTARVFHPLENPVQATAGINLGAGVLMTALGVYEMITAGGVTIEGVLALVGGMVDFITDNMAIFAETPGEKLTREKREQAELAKQAPLEFSCSQHKSVGEHKSKGLFAWMRDNPEQASGISSGIVTAFMAAIGISKLASGNTVDGLIWTGASAFYIAADILYTMFVRRDRQTEPRKEESFATRIRQEIQQPASQNSYADRVLQQRNSRGGLAAAI